MYVIGLEVRMCQWKTDFTSLPQNIFFLHVLVFANIDQSIQGIIFKECIMCQITRKAQGVSQVHLNSC